MNATDTVQPFDANDLINFSGATSWPNGDQPVIRELNDSTVTADANGVCLVCDIDCWTLELPFPTQGAAAAFLRGIPTDFIPEELGFKQL